MRSERLVLKRKLNVEFYECLATIRRQEKMPYITSVLKLVERYGGLNPEVLRDELLPEEPLALAVNILKRNVKLGFIDEYGALTELGEKAAHDNVLMPERGKYIIGVTKDPLVKSGIVYVNRDADGNQNKNSPQHDGGDKPAKLKKQEILERVNESDSLVWLDNEIKEIVIESIDDFVYPRAINITFQMQVVMDEKNTTISISKDKGEQIKFFDNSEIDFEETWDLEVKAAELKWRGGPLLMGRGLVKYEDTNASERRSFSKNIPSKEISSRSSGIFTVDPIVINIQPATDSDATLWAMELIKSEITEYCDENRYTEISEKVRRRFTDSSPSIPKIEEFIEYLYGIAENAADDLPIEYWYLQAPRDLAPVVN